MSTSELDYDVETIMTGGKKGSPPPIMHPDVDVAERDPTNLSGYIKVTFQEIIAEPEPSVFSLDKVWILSFKVFNVTKIWCYRITSTALALPMAVLCGINFACMSFCNVWVVNPLVRCLAIECHLIRQVWDMILEVVFRPLFVTLSDCITSVKMALAGE
ncbi:caveolin-3-like [Octopus sinensis]|uniref:Caveolin n=1 Tax=Octopus sinensis TaxID=2607531 RepID=A0A6P7SJ49_9MOLL|nr:caveolin-3-like [Octopus sinensis]